MVINIKYFCRSLLTDMQTLKEVDGYDKWRDNEAFALSDLVQRRLHALQNPTDCSTAKKLVCNLNKVHICIEKVHTRCTDFNIN